MAWFKRKPDPISARQRALNQELAQLEAEIKRLGAHLGPAANGQRQTTTTTLTQSSPRTDNPAAASPAAGRVPHLEPIFEQLGPDRLSPRAEPVRESALYNELGVRRYDLPALMRRIRNHFRGPTTTNPKLVSYLAAGGVQGLRPLRYEKRVARNRFLVLVTGLFLVLLGLIWTYVRHFMN